MPYKDLKVEQLDSFLQQSNTIVIDIRDIRSYKAGHLPGAEHIDGPTMSNLIQQRKNQPSVLVYCYHGMSSRDMAGIISGFGFSNVSHLAGGWQAWLNYQNQVADENSLLDDELEGAFA